MRGWLCFAMAVLVASTAAGEYQPQIKAVGAVSTNEMLVFTDTGGREVEGAGETYAALSNRVTSAAASTSLWAAVTAESNRIDTLNAQTGSWATVTGLAATWVA